MALPSIQFAAPIVRAALAQLEEYMPGQVDAFNAEGNAEIDSPASFWFGGQDLLSAHPFPQIEVAAVTGDYGAFGISRAEANSDPRVNVAIWIEGAEGDVPLLYERTLGLLRCVIECLTPVNAFGPGVEIAQEGGIVWRVDVIPVDPTAQEDDRPFQMWRGSGLCQFRLEAVEAFA